jgi:hypothetical protein
LSIDHKNIKKLIAALEEFKKLDPSMSLPSMLAFLHYHDVDGRSGNRSTVEERLDMTGATASRATLYWTDFKKPRVAGMNMLESHPDIENRRFNVIQYNRKGLEFLQKLSEALS